MGPTDEVLLPVMPDDHAHAVPALPDAERHPPLAYLHEAVIAPDLANLVRRRVSSAPKATATEVEKILVVGPGLA